MQSKAIFEAAIEIEQETKVEANIEIMIPLIFSAKELSLIKGYINEVCKKIKNNNKLHPLQEDLVHKIQH